MADNISITEGAGKTVAFKDSGSVMHQRVVAETMTDAGAPQDTSASTPMPVKSGRAEAYEDEKEVLSSLIYVNEKSNDERWYNDEK
jgi:hypothetical protein